ncbi:hypothetical protein C7455_1179 [Roseicyclus mahoneyensis]|uniref:Uncharacterized protein n=1 Tax=Roseicyclus mahoneyensis TaxID=164332 RepID=A0A316G5F4_9RHOB|nr:hypothetical protein C7455_1179 [Roseicyclus mahoneyensis]
MLGWMVKFDLRMSNENFATKESFATTGWDRHQSFGRFVS